MKGTLFRTIDCRLRQQTYCHEQKQQNVRFVAFLLS